MTASSSDPSSKDETVQVPPLETPETFPFPYAKPYDIQVQLMRVVFEAIENGKIAIVESPTGTGKSLTLLTSTLTWLKANEKRLKEHSQAEFEKKLKESGNDDPPWVIAHTVKAHLQELESKESGMLERLAKAREKEIQRKRDAKLINFGSRNKRQRLAGPEHGPAGNRNGLKTGSGLSEDDDSQFLPEDTGASTAAGSDQQDDNVSAEVKALLRQFQSKTTQEEEGEEERLKIFYTSRTHTQLRQLTSELLKTNFARIPDDIAGSTLDGGEVRHITSESAEILRPDLPTRMVPLASRRQMCINEKVQAIGKAKGDDRMNEACLDLQKADAKKGRCPFLPLKDSQDAMLDYRDQILAMPKDIEDIVQLGKELHVCPYYGTRNSLKQAELVTLPYNLILQKNARESMGISLEDQVVVVDEAHNLIDTLLSIHSVSISLKRLEVAWGQLDIYLRKFKNRLRPEHALHVKQMVAVVKGLIDVSSTWAAQDLGLNTTKGTKEEMFRINDLMNQMKGGADQVNIVSLCRYLKESQLARKISGYAEKLAGDAKESKGVRVSSHSAIAAFHQVEAFLSSLTDADLDGRIILSRAAATKDNNSSNEIDANAVTLRYMLLNPAEHFQSVIDEARCIVLAGGTMEPLSDFYLQLFPSIPRTRFSNLSCAHVIPRENLLTQVILQGPGKKDFEFKYDKRGDQSLLMELGTLLANMINLIPDGVVIFLPSYSFLDKLKEVWTGNGTLQRLDAKKKLFFEPQSSAEVETTLTQYAQAIAQREGKRTGAIMFAVVGGKLSEGINFSDELGRCVVMVGLPFANMGSIELKERMKYVEGLPNAGKNAGQELYENLCMRAVNQSIGRAIRHQNDYAALLLVDRRYSTPRISSKLPKWIGQDIKTGNFPDAVRNVAGFFRSKRKS